MSHKTHNHEDSIRHRKLCQLEHYLEDNLPGKVFQKPVVIEPYKLVEYMAVKNPAEIMLITD